jgi:hypothetical protein
LGEESGRKKESGRRRNPQVIRWLKAIIIRFHLLYHEWYVGLSLAWRVRHVSITEVPQARLFTGLK